MASPSRESTARFYHPPDIPADLDPLVSVTTITGCFPKPGLVYWYGKHGTEEANAQKQAAADVGTRVHDLLQTALTEHQPLTTATLHDEPLPIQEGLLGFEAWRVLRGLDPAHVEKVVWSRKYRYAGRADVVFWDARGFVLCDFKTGKSVYPDHLCQLAAYRQALLETLAEELGTNYKPFPVKLCLLHFDKLTGKFTPIDVTHYGPTAWKTFRALKEVWTFQWLMQEHPNWHGLQTAAPPSPESAA